MAFIIADRVQETTATTGTGTITLAGASAAFRTFAAGIGTGNTTYYCITSGNGTDWETGIGTVSGAGPYTLSRSTILSSSNSGAAIALSGTSTVFCDAPAASSPGTPPLPTVVQTAVARSASTSSAPTITMGAATTVGNTVLFMVTSYGTVSPAQGIVVPPAGAVSLVIDQGRTVNNEQISVYALQVTPAATSYAFGVTTGNGYTSVCAVELSGVGNISAITGVPGVSGNALIFPCYFEPNSLCFGVLQVDDGPASITAISAGLTQISYQTGSTNHSGWFGTVAAGYRGTQQTVTFSAAPTGNLYGVVTVSG
jgi:hypothetical protein